MFYSFFINDFMYGKIFYMKYFNINVCLHKKYVMIIIKYQN